MAGNGEVYKIKSGIPLPKIASGRRAGFTGNSVYPFREMAVGDCFYVPEGVYSTVYAAVREAAKRLGCRFAVRTIIDNEVRTIGVWRMI